MYKVFPIAAIAVLNSQRWAGTSDSVRRSNDETKFLTQLGTGIIAAEEDLLGLMDLKAVAELMNTPEWKQEELFN